MPIRVETGYKSVIVQCCCFLCAVLVGLLALRVVNGRLTKIRGSQLINLSMIRGLAPLVVRNLQTVSECSTMLPPVARSNQCEWFFQPVCPCHSSVPSCVARQETSAPGWCLVYLDEFLSAIIQHQRISRHSLPFKTMCFPAVIEVLFPAALSSRPSVKVLVGPPAFFAVPPPSEIAHSQELM